MTGAPQVLRLNPSSHAVTVRKGEEASLTLIVCADPRPRHVAWEWGSLRLESGASFGTPEIYHFLFYAFVVADFHLIRIKNRILRIFLVRNGNLS